VENRNESVRLTCDFTAKTGSLKGLNGKENKNVKTGENNVPESLQESSSMSHNSKMKISLLHN
jgi:hypothetical protein